MKYIIFIFLLATSFSCKEKSTETTTTQNNQLEDPGKDPINNPVMGGPTDIKITMTDINYSGPVQIVGFYLDQNYLQDTTTAVNGVIHYKNDKGMPQGLYYFMLQTDQTIQVILDKDQTLEMKVAMNDMFNSMQVKGSTENELMYNTYKFEQTVNPALFEVTEKLKTADEKDPNFKMLVQNRNDLENKKRTYFQEILDQNPTSLFANFKVSGQNPALRTDIPKENQVYQYREDFWKNVNFGDRRLLRTPMIGTKLTRYFKELTIQNPDSIVASAHSLMKQCSQNKEYFMVFVNWVMTTYEPGKSTLMDAESVFNQIATSYFTLDKAFWSDTTEVNFIQKRAMEMSASLVGKDAPNVISTDQNGQRQELLAKKADYIVVYLFNPDCENCQKETPLLHEFYLKNKNQVDVFAIAIDTDDKQWKNYIQKSKLSWTNVYDPTNKSIYAKYFVDHTPEMYLINKKRKIIAKNLKTFQIPTMIEKDKLNKG
ncbi:MAG: thioredoxin-like domain-containing protein [Saprospiraceae bacterium]